jgi:hypothetical protein
MLANISVAHCSRVPIAQLIRYGAQEKRSPRHGVFSRSIKQVASSLTWLSTSRCKVDHDAPPDCESKLPLLGVQSRTPSSMDSGSQPSWPGHPHRDTLTMPPTGTAECRDLGVDASTVHAPHLQRHDGAGILSKTENLVFRTRTMPGKAMSLPVRAGPRLPAVVDLQREPDEPMPSAPTPLRIDQGQRRRVARVARQQTGMLVPPSMSDIDHGDDKVALMDVLICPEALRKQAGNLFYCRDRNNALERLMQDVHQALQSPQTMLPLSSHLSLLHHLAHACAGDAERALAALHALQAGDFLALSVDLLSVGPGSYQSQQCQKQARLDALGIAAKLSSGTVEFQMLLKLIGPKYSESQHCKLQRLLQAVAQIESETESENETGQARQFDLGHHVLRAALDAACGKASMAQIILNIESAALQNMDNAYAGLSAAQKSALFSWKNGFRKDGEGSDLVLAQECIDKNTKYIKRADRMQELRNVHFDQDRCWKSLWELISAKVRIAGTYLNQSIGRKKSPVIALDTLGINNARMMQPEKELQELNDNTEIAIGLLHAKLQEARDRTSAAAVRQQLQDPLMPLPALVEHAALLAHWKALLVGQMPLGHQLDMASIREIAGKIAQDYDCQSISPMLEKKLAHWTGRELKIDDLQQWAEIHQAASSQADACGPDAAQAVEDKLGEALRKASAASTARSFPVDLSQNQVHQFMRNYLHEHNVGNTVSSRSGSTIGLNTMLLMWPIRKLNEYLGSILPLTATPALDVRFTRTRNAVINVGSTTHGFEMFIGKQKQKSFSLGAALNINVSPFLRHVGISAGAGVAAGFACDHVKTRGVMVRSRRGMHADGSGLDTAQARAEIKAFNDLMFDIAKGEYGTLQAKEVWQLIAERFFDSETLSIGWQTQQELTPHLKATAGLYERIGVGADHQGVASAGFSASRTIDLTPSGVIRRKEKSGATRQIRSSNFTRHQQITSIAAVGASAALPIHTDGTNTESLSFSQFSSTLNFLSKDQGNNVIFRTLIEQGELSAPFTLREIELRDAKHFCELLQQPECYASYLQVFNARYGIKHGEKKLQEFIQKTENWAGPGQRYLMRSRLKADVRVALNELIALANIDHRYDVGSTMQKEIEDVITQLLHAETSWVVTEIMALEAQTARDGKGINFGVQLAAQDAVVSNRELSYVAAPIPVANEWVGEPGLGTLPGIVPRRAIDFARG